jgi:hypothetical protein
MLEVSFYFNLEAFIKTDNDDFMKLNDVGSEIILNYRRDEVIAENLNHGVYGVTLGDDGNEFPTPFVWLGLSTRMRPDSF